MVKDKLNQILNKESFITSIQVDWYLWETAERNSKETKEDHHHKTYTIYY